MPTDTHGSCGCEWTPGIDLPTTECERHRNDPALAHRPPATTPNGGQDRVTDSAAGWRVGDTVLNPATGYTFTAVRGHDGDGLQWLELAPTAAYAQDEPPAGAVLLVRWVDGKPLPVVNLADGELYGIRSVT